MDNSLRDLGLNGVDSHDDPRAVRAWRWLHWILFAFSLLAIPAFYVELASGSPAFLETGRVLYMCMFAGFAASLAWMLHLSRRPKGVVQNPCFLRYTDELTRPAFLGRSSMEYESV